MTIDEQQDDIGRSGEFLTSLGIPESEWTFCYPHGKYNESLLGVLDEHGFQLAFSLHVDLASLNRANRLQLQRIDTNDLPVDGAATPNEWTRKAVDAT